MQWLIRKFKPAFSGLRCAFQDKSVLIQLVLGILTALAGLFLHLSWMEWAVIITLIGLVITAEIFNTAVERLCDYVQPEKDPKIKLIKDYSAAAVLMMAFTAAIAGIMVVIHHFLG